MTVVTQASTSGHDGQAFVGQFGFTAATGVAFSQEYVIYNVNLTLKSIVMLTVQGVVTNQGDYIAQVTDLSTPGQMKVRVMTRQTGTLTSTYTGLINYSIVN